VTRISDTLHQRFERWTGANTELSQSIVVPPGPDGRPGERILAPNPSSKPIVLTADLARTDCTLRLLRRSFFKVVCLGSVNVRGTPAESVSHSRAHLAGRKISFLSEPEPCVAAGEAAVTYSFRFSSGVSLTEWKFAHLGWLFVVGVLSDPWERVEVTPLGARVLQSWQWLDPSTESTPPK